MRIVNRHITRNGHNGSQEMGSKWLSCNSIAKTHLQRLGRTLSRSFIITFSCRSDWLNILFSLAYLRYQFSFKIRMSCFFSSSATLVFFSTTIFRHCSYISISNYIVIHCILGFNLYFNPSCALHIFWTLLNLWFVVIMMISMDYDRVSAIISPSLKCVWPYTILFIVCSVLVATGAFIVVADGSNDLRQVGHVALTTSHSSTHAWWKWWEQCRMRSDCCAVYSFKQMQQLASCNHRHVILGYCGRYDVASDRMINTRMQIVFMWICVPLLQTNLEKTWHSTISPSSTYM